MNKERILSVWTSDNNDEKDIVINELSELCEHQLPTEEISLWFCFERDFVRKMKLFCLLNHIERDIIKDHSRYINHSGNMTLIPFDINVYNTINTIEVPNKEIRYVLFESYKLLLLTGRLTVLNLVFIYKLTKPIYLGDALKEMMPYYESIFEPIIPVV